jgi:small subunit ribosomal protein S20
MTGNLTGGNHQLAHSKSALKRWRQNEAHRTRNRGVRTASRTSVRSAHTAIGNATADEARVAISEASSILDRAAKRRVIHPNTAARHKSRMMRHLNTAGAPAGEAPKKRRAPAKPKAAAKPRASKPRAAAKPRTTKAKSE